MHIRSVTPSDVEPLLQMLQTSGQFEEEDLLHISGRLNHYFSGESQDIWLSADHEGFAGIAYCAAEVMADHVWNLLMLWITPSHQRLGVGKALLAQVEKKLSAQGARILLVETSSHSHFDSARAFYGKQGFVNEARIRHYYADNDDKLIFTKNISSVK